MWFGFFGKFNVKTHDICVILPYIVIIAIPCCHSEKNVTTKREIQIENICFLAFQNIREGVTLRRVILWRLECTLFVHIYEFVIEE
jgi:hypothetical protein